MYTANSKTGNECDCAMNYSCVSAPYARSLFPLIADPILNLLTPEELAPFAGTLVQKEYLRAGFNNLFSVIERKACDPQAASFMVSAVRCAVRYAFCILEKTFFLNDVKGRFQKLRSTLNPCIMPCEKKLLYF